jgi:TPR repeat protein
MKHFALTVLLFLLFAFSPVYSQTPDFETTKALAEQGDAAAQNWIGVMYDYGDGVPENDAEAVKWYQMAAEQGDSYGQSNLGHMYDHGKGIPENNAEAVN